MCTFLGLSGYLSSAYAFMSAICVLLPFCGCGCYQSCCCAGNGGAPQAAPAVDPNPFGHAADSPAAGTFNFASSGLNFGSSVDNTLSSPFAGAPAPSLPTFGGAPGVATAGSASATAEGRATAGTKSAAKSKPGKARVKTKAATAAGPTSTAATADADLAHPPFRFSGVDPFAGKW